MTLARASVLACLLALACSEPAQPTKTEQKAEQKTEPKPSAPQPEPKPVQPQQDPPPTPLPPPLPPFVVTKLAHEGAVTDVAWSRDGSRIATCSADGKLRVWDARSFALLHTFEGWPEPPRHVALSQDGALVLAHAGNEARLYDVAAGTLRTTLTHTATTTAVAISPDGKQLSTAAADEVQVWTSEGTSMHFLEQRNKPALSLALAGEHELLSGWGDGKLRRIDLERGRFVGTPIATQGKLERIGFDGGRVLVDHADAGYELFDVQTAKLLATGPLPTPLALGVGGNLVLATGPAGEYGSMITVVDGMSGNIAREFMGHRAPIISATWSPDGGQFVSGSEDHDALIWSAP